MDLFIVIILCLACLLSFARLSAMPRIMEYVTAALLVPLSLAGQDFLAGSNLENAMRTLAGPEALANWCTLLVVQELLACLAWAKRLSALTEGRRAAVWTLFAFVPSLLLPVAVVSLRLYLFQAMVEYGFTQISIALAIACPLLCMVVAECFRLLAESRRTNMLFRLELIFLLMGIFLPVALHATLEEPNVQPIDWPRTAMVLAALGLCMAASMPLCHWFVVHRRKRMLRPKHPLE